VNEKTTAEHVYSSRVERGGIGRVVDENSRESTSGRRTTNGPLVRGRTNVYCA